MQQRTDAPGESELREEIPNPKKPRNLDARIVLGVFILTIIAQWIFRFSDMGFNQIIAAWLGGLCMLYFAFWGIYLRRKRNVKYKDEVRERRNLRDTVRGRPRFRSTTGRPWPDPRTDPRYIPSGLRRKTWDTKDYSAEIKALASELRKREI